MKIFAQNFIVRNYFGKNVSPPWVEKDLTFKYYLIIIIYCLILQSNRFNLLGPLLAMLANPPVTEIFNYLYFEQTCHYQGSKKTFPIQFLIDKLKSMYFYENFRQELLSKTLNFEQTCDLQRSKKTFRNYFLVNKSKYMYFYEYFRLELFLQEIEFANTFTNVSPPWVEKELSNSVFGR